MFDIRNNVFVTNILIKKKNYVDVYLVLHDIILLNLIKSRIFSIFFFSLHLLPYHFNQCMSYNIYLNIIQQNPLIESDKMSDRSLYKQDYK